ncbi:MAG: heparinase, partial [Planctomycetota bacterium]|nr:heparinase [Planctomycetota bacterium]
MFASFAHPQKLSKILKRYHPFPTIAERRAWQALAPSLRRRLIAEAEKTRRSAWPLLPASLYLDFTRTGGREAYQKPYFERRQRLLRLALAECAENRGRFLEEIADGIWLISEESSWCLPAHVGAQKAGSGLPDVQEPILDLFAAETGGLLAWLDYLLAERLDRVSPLLRPRLRLEIDRRVLTPFLQRDDFWWMGLKGQHVNNWNPWIISNVIFCGLLVEADN